MSTSTEKLGEWLLPRLAKNAEIYGRNLQKDLEELKKQTGKLDELTLEEFSGQYGLSEILQLEFAQNYLHDWDFMKGLEEGCKCLQEIYKSFNNKEPYGDFFNMSDVRKKIMRNFVENWHIAADESQKRYIDVGEGLNIWKKAILDEKNQYEKTWGEYQKINPFMDEWGLVYKHRSGFRDLESAMIKVAEMPREAIKYGMTGNDEPVSLGSLF